MLHGEEGVKKKKQDQRKSTWDEATDSDSEDECEKVPPKKSTKKKKEVTREKVTNSDSEGEGEELRSGHFVLPVSKKRVPLAVAAPGLE